MAKTYFLAPDWDIHPDSLIRLGNLISDPSTPTIALNPNQSERPQIPPTEIYTSTKTDWRATLERTRGGKIGVWASFLAALNVGTDATLELSTQRQSTFQFDQLETSFFQPSNTYIQQAISDPDVLFFLRSTHFMSPIYLVTGVKIARGARVEQLKKRRRQVGAHVGFDVAGTTVGPGGEVETEDTNGVAFDGSDDFVFAYRLWKIKARRDTSFRVNTQVEGGLLESVEYNRTISMSEGVDVESSEEVMEGLPPDLRHGAQIYEAVDDEDGEECTAVLPPKAEF